jgi:SEC-C motif-containing protein
MDTCPCGSGQPLALCCGQYIEGAMAPTAVALMRSRYSAHVLGKGQYLADTLSAKERPGFDVAEFEKESGQVNWQGLEIRETTGGGETDDAGTVEFVARYREGKNAGMHHERSDFIRENDRWVFDGCVFNPKGATRQVEKVGRNEPCPCGSGKKYKKCCGA